MFESKDLIYVQLQKTACSHITALLLQLFEGEHLGNHRPANQAQLASGKYIISSIRNPWDWYLSLWTYGVQGGGSLKKGLTKKKPFSYFRYALKNPNLQSLQTLYAELSKNTELWRGTYTNSDDTHAFRRWLTLMLDPSNSSILSKEYGGSRTAGFCGFMSYRYLLLCCRDAQKLGKDIVIDNYDALKQFDNMHCYIDHFIRQESLEQEFCSAIEKLRPMTDDERQAVYDAKKTNASSRSLSLADYYDEDTIALVAKRDRLLIDKFNYQPPC